MASQLKQDRNKPYPHSWSRDTCTARRAQIAKRGLYCHNCFTVCPAGSVPDEDLLCIREATSFLKPQVQRTWTEWRDV